MVVDTSFQFLTRLPSRNELERFDSDAQDWDDVRVHQPSPLDNLAVMVGYLLVSSTVRVGKGNQVDNKLPILLFSFLFGVRA